MRRDSLVQSAEAIRPDLAELDGVRVCLFSVAKARWGLALLCSYLAIVTVPAFVLGMSGSPRWLAPAVAAAFAIAARLFQWWSDTARGDAETLHRQSEYARGIGLTVDAATVATIKAKHSFLEKKWLARQSGEAGYYELDDDPSPRLLALMLRESAWWTQQLAAKASKFILATATLSTVGSILLLAIVVPDVPEPSTPFKLYAFAVCVIVSVDLFYLGVRYQALSSTAKEAFSQLSSLESENDEKKVIAAAGNYQIARQVGPLIPDWTRRWHRNKLQRIWDRTLSRR